MNIANGIELKNGKKTRLNPIATDETPRRITSNKVHNKPSNNKLVANTIWNKSN